MNNITILGLTASPYQLKMQAMADYSTLHWQRWPDQSSTFNALRALSSLGKAKRRILLPDCPICRPVLGR